MACLAKLKPGVLHNLLTGPDDSNSVIMQVPGGVQFDVSRTFDTPGGTRWYQFPTADGPGWLRGDVIELIGEDCPEPEVEEVALTLNPVADPMPEAPVVEEEPALTEETPQEPVAEEPTPVEETPQEPAPVEETPQEPVAEEPAQPQPVLKEETVRLIFINDNAVRVRDEPKVPSNILHPGLRKGVEAQWLETSEDETWYKIKLYESRQIEGWISADFGDFVELLEKQVSPNISTNPGEVIIEVPYHSQEDADAKYAWADCGPTSLRMIIGWNAVRQGKPNPGLTIDEVSKTVGIGPKQFSHFNMLLTAAQKYGLSMYHTNQATISRIKRELDFGRPVLQLVRYGSYSGRQGQRFTSGHFLVVTGYNQDHIFVNDPYWWPPRRDEGNNWAIPIHEFEHSIGPEGSALAGNNPYQAMFIDPRSL